MEVTVIVKEELKSFIVDLTEVSPRLIVVKMKLGREKWVIVSAYCLGSEKRKCLDAGFGEELTEPLRGISPLKRQSLLGI